MSTLAPTTAVMTSLTSRLIAALFAVTFTALTIPTFYSAANAGLSTVDVVAPISASNAGPIRPLL